MAGKSITSMDRATLNKMRVSIAQKARWELSKKYKDEYQELIKRQCIAQGIPTPRRIKEKASE